MKQRSADLTLFLIVIVLGATFVIVKNILLEVGPLTFLFFRFLLALLVLLPWLSRHRSSIGFAEIRAGAVLGGALAAGFAFQTIGLQSTGAGKAAFITGLNVVLVPLVARIWFQETLTARAILGICCACIGLALLSLESDLSIETGDLWILACAISFSFHVAGVTRYSSSVTTMGTNVIQIAVTTLIAGALAWKSEVQPTDISLPVALQIGFMGTIATAAILHFQIVAQRNTTATRAALLFSLEPVFAALFAWILLGETMSSRQLLGALCMLLGVVLAETRSGTNTAPTSPQPTIAA